MKRTVAFIAAATVVMSCTSCLNIGGSLKEKAVYKESVTEETGDAVELLITENVGNITLTRAEGKTAEISYKYEIKASSKELIDELYDHISADTEVSGNLLTVSYIDKVSGADIWEWIEKNHKGDLNLSVYTDIALPDSFTDFTATTDVGNVKADSLSGKFMLTSNVGSISVNSVNICDGSVLVTDVGKIEAAPNTSQGIIALKTDVGGIKLTLDSVSENECSYSAETNTGSVVLKTSGEVTEESGSNDKIKTVKIGDKCSVYMKTDVGKIIIGQEDK